MTHVPHSLSVAQSAEVLMKRLQVQGECTWDFLQVQRHDLFRSCNRKRASTGEVDVRLGCIPQRSRHDRGRMCGKSCLIAHAFAPHMNETTRSLRMLAGRGERHRQGSGRTAGDAGGEGRWRLLPCHSLCPDACRFRHTNASYCRRAAGMCQPGKTLLNDSIPGELSTHDYASCK